MRSTPRDNPITVGGVTAPHGHDPYSQPAWYTQPLPPPPPQPRKSMSTGAILAIVFGSIAALCVVATIVAALVPSPNDDTPAAQATAVATPALPSQPTSPPSTAAPAGPLATFGDGTYEIGAGAGQVAPGKYKTTVPGNSWGCYWERLSGTGGTFDEITANGNAAKGTPVLVTIAAADKAFKSERCGTWSKA